MLKNALDKNNVESGIWLPEDLRCCINANQYVHKYGLFASALKASKIILS